jgi:outer membrane protein assembly factor BamE (lipoprotein component of BamABCDE complex)
MVNKIVEGKTTQAEIETLFGKPDTIGKDGTNLRYNYIYTESKTDAQSYVFTMNVKMEGFQRILTVIFDKDNVVEKYNFSENPLNMNVN